MSEELGAEIVDERDEHELARKIRRASVTECKRCGGRVEFRVSRFAWVHATRPADDHAPQPRPLGL